MADDGERVIYQSPEVCLGHVDVGLPSRERIWQHVVRLHRAWRSFSSIGHARYCGCDTGGQVDEDEERDDTAAVRELEEQIGVTGRQLEHLMTFQPELELADGERLVFVGWGGRHGGDPVSLENIERVGALESASGLIVARQVWNFASVVGPPSVLAERLEGGS